jgi:hypothetical protein
VTALGMTVVGVLLAADLALVMIIGVLLRRARRVDTAFAAVLAQRSRWHWVRPDGTAPDPTAQTEPLTEGQRIVAEYESNSIAEPCELAEAIDRALWRALNRQ